MPQIEPSSRERAAGISGHLRRAWLLDKFPSWRMTLAHFQVSFFLADRWGLRSRKEGLWAAGRLKGGFSATWHRVRGTTKTLLLLWPAGLLLVGTLTPDIQVSRNCKFSRKAGRPFGTWTYLFTPYCPPVFPANPEPEPLSAAKTLLSALNDVKDFLWIYPSTLDLQILKVLIISLRWCHNSLSVKFVFSTYSFFFFFLCVFTNS